MGFVDLLAILSLHRQVRGLLVQVCGGLYKVAIFLNVVLDCAGGYGDSERTQYEPASNLVVRW